MRRDVCGAYTALKEIAMEESKNWTFDDWYRDGVDCFLAHELLYLCLEWNVPKDTGVSFDKYSDYQIARMAWEYNQEMDDFTRLWNHDETKLEILRECQRWLQNAYPQVEGWFGHNNGQPQEDH